jgi:hypothetical protein
MDSGYSSSDSENKTTNMILTSSSRKKSNVSEYKKEDAGKIQGRFQGYEIHVSDKYPKKYYALVNGKKVYFGDSRYQQYEDKMGYYSHLDHHDEKRRENYKKRHTKDRFNPESAGWFADNVLW